MRIPRNRLAKSTMELVRIRRGNLLDGAGNLQLDLTQFVLTPDQITAIAPDAVSLKTGRDLGTPRKWETLGGDDEVLWGLALGSGKQPYQTRVRLGDLGSKCSCPSRKFPCKHALGLMFLASSQPDVLTEKGRPPWVTEWLEAHVAREQKASARRVENEIKPLDEEAAAKRRAKRDNRVNEGVELLQKTLLDLAREGFASANARSPAMWESLAKRMVDSQVPGLAGTLRYIGDTVLGDPDVDVELPLEIGHLHLLLRSFSPDRPGGPLAAEIFSQFGAKLASENPTEVVDDQWFVAGKQTTLRDRLITRTTWLLGERSRRWARILRFAPAMQSIVDPWPLGSHVQVQLNFQAGLSPIRAIPDGDGLLTHSRIPTADEPDLEALLHRFAFALTTNPFLRTLPFLLPLRPGHNGKSLADGTGNALPWLVTDDLEFRLDCICAGNLTLVCGEWDGRHLRLLSILDADSWISLTRQRP